MNDTTLCSGNDLDATLSGLRDRGMFPWALDIVQHGYTVSYFERVAQCSAPEGKIPRMVAGSSPAALTNFAGEPRSTRGGCVNPREAAVHEQPKAVTAPVVAGEHAGNAGPSLVAPAKEASCLIAASGDGLASIEDRMAKLQDKLTAAGKIRRSKPSTPHQHARLPHPND